MIDVKNKVVVYTLVYSKEYKGWIMYVGEPGKGNPPRCVMVGQENYHFILEQARRDAEGEPEQTDGKYPRDKSKRCEIVNDKEMILMELLEELLKGIARQPGESKTETELNRN